jgi:endogenous inhibitor of DNA gyrase (YacG/DUF329 family)
MSEETIVNCPTCGKNVVWGEQSPFVHSAANAAS